MIRCKIRAPFISVANTTMNRMPDMNSLPEKGIGSLCDPQNMGIVNTNNVSNATWKMSFAIMMI